MTAEARPSIEALLGDFEFLETWEERFTYLIDLGRHLAPMPEAEQVEENRVHGCQATVYLKAEVEGNGQPVIRLRATSDAHIVSGLIAILLRMYSGRTPRDILDYDCEAVFRRLGLEEHLSPTRRNGLHAMIKRIRALAEQHAEASGRKLRIFSTEKPAPDPAPGQAPGDATATTPEERITQALRQVYDPEIPVSIYELGLIYNIKHDPETQSVRIRMTLTTPHCPEAQVIPAKVRHAVCELPDIEDCDVQIVWEPPWNKDMMSDEAKLQLGLL